MPQGSKPGERRGGRQKGTPNKVSAATRETIARVVNAFSPEELEGWIRAAAEEDPGKAVDLWAKVAEFCAPKLARTEHTGDDGGPVEFVIRDLAREGRE